MVQTRSCDPTTSVLQYDIRIRCEFKYRQYGTDQMMWPHVLQYGMIEQGRLVQHSMWPQDTTTMVTPWWYKALQNGTWIMVWFGSITKLASFEQLCNFTTVHSVPLQMCTSPNVHQICTSPLKSLQVCTSPSVYQDPNLYLFKCVPLHVCSAPLQVCTSPSVYLSKSPSVYYL